MPRKPFSKFVITALIITAGIAIAAAWLYPKIQTIRQKINAISQDQRLQISHKGVDIKWSGLPHLSVNSPTLAVESTLFKARAARIDVKPAFKQLLLLMPMQWHIFLSQLDVTFALSDLEQLQELVSSISGSAKNGSSTPIDIKTSLANFVYIHSQTREAVLEVSDVNARYKVLPNGKKNVELTGSFASSQNNLELTANSIPDIQNSWQVEASLKISTIEPLLLPTHLAKRFHDWGLDSEGKWAGDIYLESKNSNYNFLFKKVRIPLEANFFKANAVNDFNGSIRINSSSTEFKDLTLNIAGIDLAGGGIVYKTDNAAPQLRFKVNASGVKIQNFYQAAEPNAPQVYGNIDLALNGITTLDSFALQRGLSARGTIKAQDIIIERFNLLWLIISKMQAIPQMPENLIQWLPQPYQQSVQTSSTRVTAGILPVEIEGLRATFPAIRLISDGIEIRGYGWLDRYGSGRFDCELFLDTQVSQALVAANPYLKSVLNPYGQLTLPILIIQTQGQWKIIPNINYIISVFTKNFGQQILGDVLSVIQ